MTDRADDAVLPPAPARPQRLVFLGTPWMAVPSLRALHAAGFDIPVVITRTDKRRGRGGGLSPSAVKAAAEELGLTVSHDLDVAAEVEADLGVVVAYGRLIPVSVLQRLPMINIHFSLLPRWRGAAPVERALLAGDDETGVCLMEVAEGLDTGAVYATRRTPIEADDTLERLRHRLVELGTELLVAELQSGLAAPKPQEGEPTYAAKVGSAEYQLDLTRSASELDRVVRLGRAWTLFRGKRLKILDATPLPAAGSEPGTLVGTQLMTGDGMLVLHTVQPEGKRAISAADWLNGVQPTPGERLG